MEDDIQVGIQLQLEDNVSDALSVIMKQLDAADRAIAATSVNWEGLRLPGDGTHSPLLTFPEPPTEQHPAAAARYADPSGELIPSSPFAAPSPTAHQLPTEAEPQEASRGSASLGSVGYAPVLPATTETPDEWLNPPHAASLLGEKSYDTVALPNRRASVPMPPEIASPPFAFAAPDITVPTASAAPMPPDDDPADVPMVPLSVDLSREGRLPPNFAPMSSVQASGISPRGANAAEIAPAASNIAPSGGSTSDTLATAPNDGSGGGEGQLMLDGSLLGRWIIDHLAREADRPPAGGTAFDPRQGRPWSSIGHGN